MNIAVVTSRAQDGISAPQVKVEVHISNGLPSFSLVGLPETSVREAKDRVRSAIINGGFEFPMRRITVNLAPADLPKNGGRYDLAIAIGVLVASCQIDSNLINGKEFVGELGLNGEVRFCSGLLPAIVASLDASTEFIMPYANLNDNYIVQHDKVFLMKSLSDLKDALSNVDQNIDFTEKFLPNSKSYIDMNEIVGQASAKKALEIAAAGGHNLLMIGSPGTGKSMLANAFLGIMPLLTKEQALEVASIASIANVNRKKEDFYTKPFRNPHHTSSSSSLVGGGSIPMPGEISLAHLGVLFLDELPEFPRKVLDSLREPLETKEVKISRARYKATFPAKFQLIAAMNPSPCGNIDHQARSSFNEIRRYLSRLSTPFLDRFDLSVDVPRLPKGLLASSSAGSGESSDIIRQRVMAVQDRQMGRQGVLNFELSSKFIRKNNFFEQSDLVFLEETIIKLKLSVRSFYRILKVALTIADLLEIKPNKDSIIQALNYRAADKLIFKIHENM